MDEDVPCLSLKWNYFKENFTSQFEHLKEEEEFVDVTLSCQGKLLRAHKVVLSASSPYLTSLLKENPCKHPVLILDSMPYSHLQSLLAFIYTGAVSVVETELPAFLESANMLQIRGLSDRPAPTPTAAPTKSIPDNELNVRKRSGAAIEEIVPFKRYSTTSVTPTARQSTPLTDSELRIIHPNPSLVKKEESSWPDLDFESEFEMKNERHESEATCSERRNEGAEVSSDGTETPVAQAISVNEEPTHTSTLTDYLPASTTGDSRRRHSLDPRPCPICNRLYSNVSNLRQHLRLIHNPTIVTCKLCSKTFKTDLYMRRHLISYHGESPVTPDPSAPHLFKELFPPLHTQS